MFRSLDPMTRSPGILLVLALVGHCTGCGRHPPAAGDEFQRLTSQGRSYLESGDAAKAADVLREAVALQPTHPDAHQNLAVALLRANDPAGAAEEARALIHLNQNLAAAHYLLGAALLRQGNPEAAVPELQTSKDMDRTVNAVSYLLGRAQEQLGHLDEAAALYDEVVQFDTNHPAAFYNLSQVLNRLGRRDEAAQALAQHQAIQARRGGASIDEAAVEACVYTGIRVPFRLDQPDPQGVPVTFRDASGDFLGAHATQFAGPFAILDVNHTGTNSLFARDGEAAFRLLINTGGKLTPATTPVAVTPGARYDKVLVGDLNRDRYEDIVILGDRGLHAFRLATNGLMTDSTAFSNLRNQPAVDGLLADLDFTGNLDLILITPTNHAVQVLRNLGSMYFTNGTPSSGFPPDLRGVDRLVTDDWNGDDINDFFVGRSNQPPLLLTKERAGELVPSPGVDGWPTGAMFAVADFNNDLRNDLVVAGQGQLTLVFSGFSQHLTLPAAGENLRALVPLDYDNDGWLDLLATTDHGLRAWRNGGNARFTETTAALDLTRAISGRIAELRSVDLDNDGDSDLVVALEGGGLRVLRNDGGNANHQLDLRLMGTRSNPSGLGLRIELTSGNWRALRTVHQLPIEIGVGRRDKIDTLNVRWFDALSTDVDTPVVPGQQLALIELVRPTGSCPYLYRWNGDQFTFVTDLLGASPLGLPVAAGRSIEADPDEIVEIGPATDLPTRDGYYTIQVTEELREVLYLDHAQLLAVDHPRGTEVHPTDKLVPGRPFPPTGVMTLGTRIPLRAATDLAGTDVTAALQDIDHVLVSPARLRPPQERGYAEPHGIILDFGRIPAGQSLVLAMTGWLRFGGGMANIAASRDPDLPFPFPRLEAECDSEWKPVDVGVGAPCGKTKTILVDLGGKLPPGTRRLRLTTSFEIHWDRIALFKRPASDSSETTVITRLLPDRTDLHWRGYSEFKDLPWTEPLTPDYAKVRSWPDWRITPSGWCTRYGPVGELLAGRDGGLVVLNGGDELTLEFSAARLPPLTAGRERTLFLFTVGWDKDADFHVVEGDRVEPLPWEGMDDQQYGRQQRPSQPGDSLNRKYNTRWVGSLARIRK